MKIDLHCHTKKVKKGDGNLRNVSPELFKEKVGIADVKIVAITNHNAFDFEQYNVLKESVKEFCQVWPGVEIDICGDTKFHLIIVTKIEDAEQFSVSVANLFEDDDLDTCQHSLEEVCATFQKFNTIYIPHFHDKKPAISDSDRDKLSELVGDDSRVFIEPRNYRTLGVLANKEMNVLIGSDVKDWSQYEKCTFADLRLPIGSFSEFLLLAKRDKTVVNTLLNKKAPIMINGKPHPSVDLPLSIYPDINIVFGPKGTGKTEILNSLYKVMVADGKTCKKYIASERGDEFSSLLTTRDMDLDLNKIHANPCESEFEVLINWTDSNPTQFSNYLDWSKTKGNSNNKSRMKITEAIHDNYYRSEKYDVHGSDKCHVGQAIDLLKNVELHEYISEDEIKKFSFLLDTLAKNVWFIRETDLISEYSSKLTNWSIDTLKSLADKSSDTVSRPSKAGLKEFAQQRLELHKAVNTILANLTLPEKNEKERIGTLEDKGDIFVNKKYRLLCPEERTVNFPGINITVLRELRVKLEYIHSHIFDENLTEYIEGFNTMCKENSIKSIKPFLGRSKQIVTADGNVYEPSNGEKGILLLQRILHEDADAYFLDEPELGMGNSYIDTDIRPLLSDLAKRRKHVVVATHNANIAVRTLPYTSIFRTHENGTYKTYVGNPFDDLLINIENSEDIRSWTEESMHSLEGGHDAFYERKDIYEARNGEG